VNKHSVAAPVLSPMLASGLAIRALPHSSGSVTQLRSAFSAPVKPCCDAKVGRSEEKPHAINKCVLTRSSAALPRRTTAARRVPSALSCLAAASKALQSSRRKRVLSTLSRKHKVLF
jgi:hypothetical protein